MNRSQKRVALGAAGLAAALAIGACGGSGGGASGSGTTTAAGSARIPQPPLSSLNRITRRRLAPNSRRVDLTVPTFSDPTKVTNPLFPISKLQSVVILGEVGGAPLKVETTFLPETKTVQWNGQRIECLQSQFLAYLRGRITESAIDLYAQADDGSVCTSARTLSTTRRDWWPRVRAPGEWL